MRALLQRVRSGSVVVADETVGVVDHGLVILAAVGREDTLREVQRMAAKIVHLRIFNDENGRFNHSLLDVGGGVLVVSQFTLYADARRGRRPNFTDAAAPETAQDLLEQFATMLEGLGVAQVATGCFGASMLVELQNDGPVTIWLDTDEWGEGR